MLLQRFYRVFRSDSSLGGQRPDLEVAAGWWWAQRLVHERHQRKAKAHVPQFKRVALSEGFNFASSTPTEGHGAD